MRTHAFALVFALIVIGVSAPVTSGRQAQSQTAPPLTDAEMEAFLRTARVTQSRELTKGITASIRATLSDGTVTHDAHIQNVYLTKTAFETRKGVEFNFRDSWHFNIAAYRIDRLLDLRLVPVSVQRNWKGTGAAFTWWVDEVLMDEGERMNQQRLPPDTACWTEQTRLLRLFDQLVDNSDRNVGNTLISKNWRIWAIDHTRAFRYSKTLRNPAQVTGIDRAVLARLEALDFATIKRAVEGHITDGDIRTLLSRRDAILAHLRGLGSAALYDRRDPAAGCSGG